jgi:Uncharacterized conserved protein related to C-terminal domain of eukaryotic chaperone, SACSIN, COG2250
MYDTAAFLAKQAAQLFIKHKILELTGEMPRTHTIRQFIAVLAECTGGRRREELTEFAKRSRSLLISSRKLTSHPDTPSGVRQG